MYYTGFAERITKRYGIVVKNWPFERFENPSSISTGAAVETLLHSWNSGATHFYRMSSQEFKDWLDAHNATASEANMGGNGVGEQGDIEMEGSASQGIPTPSPTPIPITAPNPTAFDPTAAPAPIPASTSQFVAMAMVTDANGVAVPVRSNTRKKRSDKGKPRKKRSTVAAGEGSVTI